MSHISKKALTALFPGADFLQLTAVNKMRVFAAQYPEMNFDESTETIHFATEDIAFKISHDTSWISGEPSLVFKGQIISFAPETIEFDSGWCPSISKAFEAMQVGWSKMEW